MEGKGVVVIEFDAVDYGYGEAPLLRDVSLTLAPGSFYFLTGPSGSGKTTMINLCYGALLPTRGRISLFGQNVANIDREAMTMLRRKVAVVHQNVQFIDHLNLRENIGLPLSVTDRLTAAAEVDLTELLGWVGLTHRANAFPQELSGGERQRAALARAIIVAPDFVLADEPTGNVDWEMSQRLLTLLVEFNRLGRTILIATHDLALIRAAKAQVPARVLRISNGQVQLAGAEL